MKSYLTPLLSVIVSLSLLTGCTKTCTTKDPQIERIEVIKEKIEKIKYDIPEGMLTECEWFAPIEEPTQQSLAKTNKINAERFEKCFYMNNAKAQFLKTLRQEDGE